MAGRDAVPLLSAFSNGGKGSREGSLIGELLSDGDRYFRACQAFSTVTWLRGPVGSAILPTNGGSWVRGSPTSCFVFASVRAENIRRGITVCSFVLLYEYCVARKSPTVEHDRRQGVAAAYVRDRNAPRTPPSYTYSGQGVYSSS